MLIVHQKNINITNVSSYHYTVRQILALEDIVFISKVLDAPWQDAGDIHFSNGNAVLLHSKG